MKHKLSKLAVGLLVACAFSGQANAAPTPVVTNLGALGQYNDVSFSGSLTKPGAFIDLFTFTVVNTDGTATVNASYLNNNGINPLSFALYSGTDYKNLANDTLVVQGTKDGKFQQGIDNAVYLTTGTHYFLDVSGTALSSTSVAKPAHFNGDLTISPVPEPTEGALLLSGLGLMGFIAARRGRQDA